MNTAAAASGLGDSLNGLNIPSSATAAKQSKNKGDASASAGKVAGANSSSLIQEIKKGDAPVVAKPTTAGAAASATISTPAPSLMKEVTSTKRTVAFAPPAAPTPADVKEKEGSIGDRTTTDTPVTVLVNGVEHQVPKYTMKERGHISMGDFNANSTAKSSRPSELVYKVELPKIAKASDIVLDIAER